jgi:hypothetical protein
LKRLKPGIENARKRASLNAFRLQPFLKEGPTPLRGKPRERGSIDVVLAFPLTSIRSAKHLQEAQKVIDRLLAIGDLDEGQATYLDALSDLVAAYEDEHCLSRRLRMRTCFGISWKPITSPRRS